MLLGKTPPIHRYGIPGSLQQFELSTATLEIFNRYRQDHASLEAGGLLFAEFRLPDILITEASRPNKQDKRTRNRFIPARKPRKRLIEQRFNEGLHLVGEWHTHPQERPVPSPIDLESMQDSFSKSKHELNAFLLVIVGSSRPELSLWVSLHDSTGYVRLSRLRS